MAPVGPGPPRFTWEVYPGLYPSQPKLRRPRFGWRAVIVPVLLVIAVLTTVIAVGGAYYGWAGSEPATYTVSGVAQLSGGHPWISGTITVTDEAGTTSKTIPAGGAFDFPNVPTGGVNLNVTYAGYAPLLVETFVSPIYDAGSQGLRLTLSPGGPANASVVYLTPFHGGVPDLAQLEIFQTSVGSAAAIAGIAALFSGTTALYVRRADRPALGIVGGASGAVVPFGLLILSVGLVFPYLLLAGLVSGVLGAFAFAIAWIEIIQAPDRPMPTAKP